MDHQIEFDNDASSSNTDVDVNLDVVIKDNPNSDKINWDSYGN